MCDVSQWLQISTLAGKVGLLSQYFRWFGVSCCQLHRSRADSGGGPDRYQAKMCRYRVLYWSETILNTGSGLGRCLAVSHSRYYRQSLHHHQLGILSSACCCHDHFREPRIWHSWIREQLYPAYSCMISTILPSTDLCQVPIDDNYRDKDYYQGLLKCRVLIPTTDFWPWYRVTPTSDF